MKPLLSILFFVFAFNANANDSILVKFSKLSFSAKDSIEFSCRIPDHAAKGLSAATMNVWIQDTEKGQVWKFRYPILNGVLDAALAIGDSIPPGKYAVNFILQKGLFRVQGIVKNNHTHTSLNYMAQMKGDKKLVNSVELSSSGAFLLKNILFEDQALFIFTPGKKVKKNDLFIDVVTPLDSAFAPLAIHTQIIDIKPELRTNENETSQPYTFNFDKTLHNSILPEVTVVYKGKKKVEQYDNLYSTGLFRDDNARVFDGMENIEIMDYMDIPSFLITKIPGLSVSSDGNLMIWRNEPVMVYIDEFRLEQGDPIYITPSEVAMIKVYNPPAAVNGGFSFGGAVAIYTKRGSFETNATRKFKFVFKGYTGFDSAWR
jgi:hypothetical protein